MSREDKPSTCLCRRHNYRPNVCTWLCLGQQQQQQQQKGSYLNLLCVLISVSVCLLFTSVQSSVFVTNVAKEINRSGLLLFKSSWNSPRGRFPDRVWRDGPARNTVWGWRQPQAYNGLFLGDRTDNPARYWNIKHEKEGAKKKEEAGEEEGGGGGGEEEENQKVDET